MAKKRKFGRGGTTVDAPSTADVLSGVSADRKDTPDISVEPKLSKGAARQDMSFGQAFRDARNSGDSTFTWRGRSYGTQLASERPAPARRAATPAPAPARRVATPPPTPARRVATSSPAPARRVALSVPSLAPARRVATPSPAPARRVATPSPAPARRVATPSPAPARRVATPSPAPARNPRSSTAERERVHNQRMGVFGAYAKGGSVSSRGDGIAKRGRTKGEMK